LSSPSRRRALDRDCAPRVLRFDLAARLLHWSTTGLFLVLIATALPLYFPQVESLVGRRAMLAHVHLWAGIALPVPFAVAVAGPWGVKVRRDLRRVNLWSRDEVRWMRSLGRRAIRVTDKFNPGQKLNAIFIAGSIVVMLGTGLIMQWYGVAPKFRTGATFVHDVLATVLVVVIVGHVGVALAHPEALRSMWRGWVSETGARQHGS
jgi:formate dehydrogenase subunit gamma